MDEAASRLEAIGAPGKPPPDLAARVHAARIRLFYKQQLATIAASSVIAVLLVLILWSEASPPMLLIGWLAGMIIAILRRDRVLAAEAARLDAQRRAQR